MYNLEYFFVFKALTFYEDTLFVNSYKVAQLSTNDLSLRIGRERLYAVNFSIKDEYTRVLNEQRAILLLYTSHCCSENPLYPASTALFPVSAKHPHQALPSLSSAPLLWFALKKPSQLTKSSLQVLLHRFFYRFCCSIFLQCRAAED